LLLLLLWYDGNVVGDDGDEDDEDDYDDDSGITTHQMPRYYMNINPINSIMFVAVLMTYRRTVSFDGSVRNKLKIDFWKKLRHAEKMVV